LEAEELGFARQALSAASGLSRLTASVVGNNKKAVVEHDAIKTDCNKRLSEIKSKKATPGP
jgi:hypothetical protein